MATVSMLEEFAQRLDFPQMSDGLSVRESFYRRKMRNTDYLVADFADTSPTPATRVKAVWDRVRADYERALEHADP